MSSISGLWHEEQLPVRRGLYTADGAAFAVRVTEGRLAIGAEFDLDALLAADPAGGLASVDITREIAIPGGSLCCGQATDRPAGFFARLDADRELVWAVYLPDAGPFNSITIHGDTATFRAAAGAPVTVDLRGRTP